MSEEKLQYQLFRKGAICVLAVLLISCGRDSDPAPSSASKSKGVSMLELARQPDGRLLLRSTGQLFTGLQYEEWPDGKVRLEYSFVDGRREGLSKAWHANGQLGLRGEWREGYPVGKVEEWSPDGLLKRTMVYRDRQLVTDTTEASEAAQTKIDAELRERERLDQENWKSEVLAQDFERTFVHLWDRLRAEKHAWSVWEEFPFESITWGKPEDSTVHDWAIETRTWNAPSQRLEFSQWKMLLLEWAQNYVLEESEWHQEEFDPSSEGHRSLFKFTLHARAKEKSERLILRGALRVYWGEKRDAKGFWQPVKLVVESLKEWRRSGETRFETAGLLRVRRDNPQFTRTRIPNGVDPAPLLIRDLNGDHLPEIIPTGANLVYWNQGGFRFEPKPLLSDGRGQFPDAAAIVDFTGDGRPDLLTFGPDQKPMVFSGKPDGNFAEPPIVSLSDVARTQLSDPSAVAVGDVDGDGDLDAFVPQYLNPYAGGRAPTPYYAALDGLPAYLLINDGTGQFTDGTAQAGLAPKRLRRTYSTSLVDLDGDHDLDLVVVSDFSGLDLYLNDGKGKFKDITDTLGAAHYSFGMSHAFADFNADGNMDMYMVGMGSTTARRLEHLGLGRKGFESVQAARMKMGYGNRLLLGDGNGGFRQAPYNDSLARTGWAWGCTPWDFDNDGDRDLYIANGHISGSSAKDYCTKFWRHDIYTPKIDTQSVIMAGVFKECQSELGVTESWNGFEHNVLYLNEGDGNYLSISHLMGLSIEADCRSVVSADLDLDGRADLLVVEKEVGDDRQRDGQIRLVRNLTPSENNWIGLHLEAKADQIIWGARVRVYQVDGAMQELPVVTGDSWKAQHGTSVHFGLGKAEAARLEVIWPNGKVTRIDQPAVNKYHTLEASK